MIRGLVFLCFTASYISHLALLLVVRVILWPRKKYRYQNELTTDNTLLTECLRILKHMDAESFQDYDSWAALLVVLVGLLRLRASTRRAVTSRGVQYGQRPCLCPSGFVYSDSSKVQLKTFDEAAHSTHHSSLTTTSSPSSSIRPASEKERAVA
jgi:hypothetical protein